MKALKGRKKLLAIAMAFVMMLALVPLVPATVDATTSQPIRVTVNGRWVAFPDQHPVMVENRLLVPIGATFHEMGFATSWDAATRMARLTRSDFTIVVPAGAESFVVNNVIVEPEVPQRMINNRLMLPLRAIAYSVGGTAIWDPVARIAHISVPLAPAVSPTPPPATPNPPTPTPTPATPTPTPTPASQSLLTAAPRFEGSTGFGFGGNAYMLGIRYENAIWGGGWSRHNLGNRFDTLTATIGRFDGSGNAARNIRFIGDGRVLATYTVAGDVFTPVNITVNVRNVSILTIEIDAPGTDGVSLVMANSFVHVAVPGTTPTPSPRPFLEAVPSFEGSTGFATGANAYMLGVRYPNAIFGGGWSHHNLAGNFSTITALLGRFDGAGHEARYVRFIGDGQVINTFRVQGSPFNPINVIIDVRGVQFLRIEIDAPLTHGNTVVLGNIMIY